MGKRRGRRGEREKGRIGEREKGGKGESEKSGKSESGSERRARGMEHGAQPAMKESTELKHGT